MRPYLRRRLVIDAAALLIAAVTLSSSVLADGGARDWPASGPAPVAIDVHSMPLPSFDLRDRSHVRFGQLEYRGGLILTSSFRRFGGLSGLRLDDDGNGFLAVSDKGHWFRGRLRYNGKALAGLSDVVAAPLLGENGRTITSRGWYDSESLARDGGIAYVGLERVHQILRFDIGADGLRARGTALPVPAAMKRLPRNKGIEALVAVPRGRPLGGTLIAISERGLDRDGNIIAFLIGGPTPGQFAVKRTADYDISDATSLPDGSVVLLERKFSLTGGVGIRIRRIRLDQFAPDALVDGPVIFEADLGYEIDNFEGIDAHITPEGETVLTLVSDDNFFMLQRTLLVQFTLLEP